MSVDIENKFRAVREMLSYYDCDTSLGKTHVDNFRKNVVGMFECYGYNLPGWRESLLGSSTITFSEAGDTYFVRASNGRKNWEVGYIMRVALHDRAEVREKIYVVEMDSDLEGAFTTLSDAKQAAITWLEEHDFMDGAKPLIIEDTQFPGMGPAHG